MASRASLNKVLLIGNLTRDPELRYTPSGAAVVSFTVATNRVYVAKDGEKKEESEFTRVIAWNKLAELCSQLLTKGRKVYVEGRLQTRSWESPDGQQKNQTEVVIDDMRILDSRRTEGAEEGSFVDLGVEEHVKLPAEDSSDGSKEAKATKDVEEDSSKAAKGNKDKKKEKEEEDLSLDDLPF